ncbi:MAG: diaminopimelate epimerase [Lachnospiraceae bacterium]|nr:diaminopimelate epimerase [Lachnospiraceae bacterium]
MKFTKMQGCGNDYVYVNCFKETIENQKETAIKISDRHFGVGSDGMILICPSDVADFKMVMYNADGSQAQMCGNGIRCVGKYVYDYGLTKQTKVTVETLAGIKHLSLCVKEGKVSEVTVNMGSPVTEAGKIPVIAEKSPVVAEPIEVEGRKEVMTCVSMGNPHAVFFVEDPLSLPLEQIGPAYETHERFPENINTEFVKVIDRNTLLMRVWERGSGETLACGTGACACAYAAILNGYTEDTVTVKLLGGDLKIRYDREENVIYMTGPAETVFEGEY